MGRLWSGANPVHHFSQVMEWTRPHYNISWKIYWLIMLFSYIYLRPRVLNTLVSPTHLTSKYFNHATTTKANLRFARSNRLTNRQSLRSLAPTWICRTWLYNLVKQDGQLQRYTTSHHTLKSTLCVTGGQLQICIGGIQNHELPLYPTYLIRLQQYVLLIYTLQGHLVAWRSHQPEP